MQVTGQLWICLGRLSKKTMLQTGEENPKIKRIIREIVE